MDLPSARSVSPTKETDLSLDLDFKRSSASYASPPQSAGLSRTPTLSWQRRPQSQGPGPRSRPLSMVAAENAAVRSSTPPAEASSPDREPSRDQISQALASKDPAWFRQTADRGASSAAYRKSQVEDVDTVDVLSGRAQLHGMSRPTSTEPEREAVRSRPTSQIISRTGSPRLSISDAQKLGPPADIQSGYDGSGSGRSSPTRPASPTKGMGGFVQSALMKRTDSVKRWSVTTPGLQRGNTAANRNSYDNKSAGNSPTHENSRPVSRSRDSVSRPSSSHRKDPEPPVEASQPAETSPVSPKPEILRPDDDGEKTPPTSPSRTMDPRRWSPSKGSSWLDAALKAPESPKPKPSPAVSNQPAWMVELNRAKAERAKNPSVDIGRAGSAAKKHEVKTGGLVRPAPMGATVKPPSLGGVKSPAIGIERPITPGLRTGGAAQSPALDKLSPAGEDIGRRASVNSLPPNKDKVDTPPKKDFRTVLRPRGTTLGNADKTEPTNELANVFGNLRKAKTQNYVAPDELKNNITRGKAALNVTGGPRPYEKKDEFKDAILKKKSEFNLAKQEGRGVATNQKPPEEKPLPEGLARRATISRSKSISHSRNSSIVQSPPDSAAQITEPPRPVEPVAPSPSRVNVEEKPAAAERTVPEPSEPVSAEKSVPGRLPNKIGGGLANRFNPALAGLLARGPPGMGGPSGPAGGSSGSGGSDAGKEPGPGPQLTHMTKNRVRGPRRKAPTSASKTPSTGAAPESVAQEQASTAISTSPSPAEAEPSSVDMTREEPKPEPVASPRSSVTSPAAVAADQSQAVLADSRSRNSGVISLVDSSSRKLAEQQPLSTGSKIALVDSSNPAGSPISPKKISDQVAAIAAKVQPVEEKKPEEQPPRSPSPRKLDARRMSRFLDETVQSPKIEPEVRRSPSPVKRPFSGPSSPTKVPDPEKVDSQPTISVKNGSSIFENPVTPIKSPRQEDPPRQQQSEKHVPAPLNLRSSSPVKPSPATTLPAQPRENAFSPPPLTSPTRSPSKSGSEVSAMLKDFFGKERPKREYRVDAAEILMNKPREGAVVRTQKTQLFQITEQGKRVPVPAHHERVLFEREMYLCAHTFVNGAGKKVQEVYFWIGDDVAPSAVEDAQVFASREARSLGGTLIHIRQGKETAELIQALGGIIIIRRGSSNKYDSLASSMLCGRNYQGQVVFDEVDFGPLTLCSGFPYIIAQAGKCYLWKGKGAGVDELGCARLIGMDSALMGEVIEVEEGSEPESFWNLFDGQKKMSSADHWRLKPSYDKYCGRLFCSDAADPRQVCNLNTPAPIALKVLTYQKVIEISPFAQSDLSSQKIYVLDAFFEMYIIVGRDAQSQYASFHNGLDFAQEYAILAAGMEDRPFVPVSTVVLEGIPRDLRSCFRKWLDRQSPTRMAPSASGSNGGISGGRTPSPLKRARSLKLVPLGQALQALGNPE